MLKKRTNQILIEYARKRDSCSFLISSFILEEHFNDFYIYSSNKFGSNKDKAAKITIENKFFFINNSNNLINISNNQNKRLTFILTFVCLSVLLFLIFCCLSIICKNSTKKQKINVCNNNNNNNQIYNNYHSRQSSHTLDQSFPTFSNHIDFKEPIMYQFDHDSKALNKNNLIKKNDEGNFIK